MHLISVGQRAPGADIPAGGCKEMIEELPCRLKFCILKRKPSLLSQALYSWALRRCSPNDVRDISTLLGLSLHVLP